MALISILLSCVLAVLTAIHIYWAFGGTGGKGIAIPEKHGRPLFTPSQTMTIGVAGCLAFAAVVAAIRGGLFWPTGDHVGWRIGSAMIGLAFAARAIGERRYVGLFKRVKGTPFAHWDTWLFTPLCIMMAAGFLVLFFLK